MASAQRRKKMIRFIIKKGMTRREAAEYFDVSLSTMHSYLRPLGNAASRGIPDHIWEQIKNV